MDELDQDQKLKLDALDEEYRRRHGAAVELLKQQIGEGDLYQNSAARAMISPQGAWCELVDLPMEFTGLSGGGVSWRFVEEAEAVALLESLCAVVEAAAASRRPAGLLALYTRRGLEDQRGVFTLDYAANARAPRRIGTFRPGVAPLAYRVRLDEPEVVAGLSFRRGVVFCITGIGERSLLIELPHDAPDTHDLGRHPSRRIPQ